MPPHLAIAVDLGTSGIRAQALDLRSETIVATAITTHHPLPGANVMDHLHFALEMGVETAQRLLVAAVNQVITALQVSTGQVARLAVCGNPSQLSLFQGIEIRDLAYAGPRKLAALGVVPPAREGDVVLAHYMLAHSIAPNCGPNIRYQVYFRVNARRPEQVHHPEPMLDLWLVRSLRRVVFLIFFSCRYFLCLRFSKVVCGFQSSCAIRSQC